MPKRRCTYAKTWEIEYNFIKKSRKGEHYAYCVFCNCDIDISFKGKGNVAQHTESSKHKLNARNVSTTSNIQTFYKNRVSSELEKVAATELCIVYHSVKHHHSFRSVACTVKLNNILFSDSEVAKQMTCGRTKCKAISDNVLAPYSVYIHIKEKNISFSVSSDASNRGSVKCFPLVIRYFHEEKGIQYCLLDFYEDSSETSAAISSNIIERLSVAGLKISNLSAYTGDNASVNYGVRNSVFQKLKDKNSSILPANCYAHMLHNSMRFACSNLHLDFENIVLKVYAHFSMYASRVEQFREFCNFTGVEYEKIIRHVVTRWLSLLPAIDRLGKCWKALTSYFQSLGEERCSKVIWDTFGNEENNEIAELYCLFLSHALRIFTSTVEALESNTFTVTSLYKLMKDVDKKLTHRINDKFFGYIVNTKLRTLSSSKRKKCELDFIEFYKRGQKYIQERYDLGDENVHKRYSFLSLENADCTFEDFASAVKACNVEIDIDMLYEEFKAYQEIARSTNFKNLKSVEERYKELLKSGSVAGLSGEQSFKSFRKIASFILSISCSNAYVERVFSIMKITWREERSRMDVSTLKSELQICCNFQTPQDQDDSCKEMFNVFLKNKRLLKAAMEDKKYKPLE